MRLFFIGLFISFHSYGITLSQFRTTSEATSLQEFLLVDGKASYNKKSNFFDPSLDLRLGRFTYSGKETLPVEKSLKAVLAKIVIADKILKSKKRSFNDLSGNDKHQSVLILDGFKVTPESDLYSELKINFNALINLKWEIQKGISLSSDHAKVTQINNGKPSAPQPFNFAFSCQSQSPPTVCGFKDLGVLFIPKNN